MYKHRIAAKRVIREMRRLRRYATRTSPPKIPLRDFATQNFDCAPHVIPGVGEAEVKTRRANGNAVWILWGFAQDDRAEGTTSRIAAKRGARGHSDLWSHSPPTRVRCHDNKKSPCTVCREIFHVCILNYLSVDASRQSKRSWQEGQIRSLGSQVSSKQTFAPQWGQVAS